MRAEIDTQLTRGLQSTSSMFNIRRARVVLAACWLVMQSALLIAPSIVLLAHEETATECTCAHGEHAICPMHHRSVPGSRICLIGSADHTLGTLGSLFQAAGLIPAMTSAAAPPAVPVASI